MGRKLVTGFGERGFDSFEKVRGDIAISDYRGFSREPGCLDARSALVDEARGDENLVGAGAELNGDGIH